MSNIYTVKCGLSHAISSFRILSQHLHVTIILSNLCKLLRGILRTLSAIHAECPELHKFFFSFLPPFPPALSSSSSSSFFFDYTQQCEKVTLDGAWGVPYGKPGIGPGLTVCKASILPTELSNHTHIPQFFNKIFRLIFLKFLYFPVVVVKKMKS